MASVQKMRYSNAMTDDKSKLSTDPYKGVRDFYPEDQFIQKYMYEHMARTCELFGYEEYNASVLEPAEMYRTKTSSEIVNEQSYLFTDRGEREVMLRPEMTPTVARMFAAKSRELPRPTRWYSVQNFFRYEKSQKGRVREFWQLNADIIGASGIEADAEIIVLAHNTLISMGASEVDFEVRVSDRRILQSLFESTQIEAELHSSVTRLLDRRAKLQDFDAQLSSLIGIDRAAALTSLIDSTTSSAYLEELRQLLARLGVHNMIVDTSITRGFDYYTGMVFEIFDTDTENRRSIAGGGRYDNLLSIFGGEPVPTVGFAMGDVTTRYFLEAHKLLPAYAPSTELMIAVLDDASMTHALELAQFLRTEDVSVAVNFSRKRIGDQVRQADKMNVPFVIAVGSTERESGMYSLKQLSTGDEKKVTKDRIAEHLFSSVA